MGISIDATLTGLEEVEAKLIEVESLASDLRRTVAELHDAARSIGLKISQPPAGTDG